MTTQTQTLIGPAGFEQIQAAANIIKDRLDLPDFSEVKPIGIVLGSGLGDFADNLKQQSNSTEIEYEAISHFPVPSVDGHQGKLFFVYLDNNPVLAMQGRVHLYEGYTPAQVIFPIRVLMALGVKNLVLTNAAGGIASDFEPGDLMLIRDHINLTGNNPLLGLNDMRFGLHFLDMSETYNKRLRKLTQKSAKKLKLDLKEGIYAGVLGPTYETPAEIKMMSTIGADAVGMSTVYEAIAARHQGANVLGISCITNKAAGLSDTRLCHDEVKDVASKVGDSFSALLFDLIPELT